ncbi:MAG: OmpA family protein [Proteobacteria bacterium]|nr:OmpA family protein [Pseudomonadota bacterium]
MGKKKKKGSDDDVGDGGFMMMFVTLSLILLAFFILLNSMAVINADRKKAALGSLLGSFGLMSGSGSTGQGKEGKMGKESLIGGDGMVQMFEQTQKLLDKMRKSSGVDAESAEVTFDKAKGNIKLVLADQLVFPAGTSVISLKLFPILDHIAAIALQSDGSVTVTGHTDDRRVRGGVSNWELSLQRGTIVARHLEAIGPLSREKVCAAGASHYKPRSKNKTAAGRAANRRVEILIKTRKEE